MLTLKGDANWDETVDHPLIGKFERWGRDRIVDFASLFLSQKPVKDFSLKNVKRILLIKEPYRTGDLLQITPTIRALKKNFPEIYLGLVIQDRNYEIFKNNTDLDEIFVFEKNMFVRSPLKCVQFFKNIRQKKIELAVTLETQRTHLTNDLIAYFSGAPFSLRYDGKAFGNIESNIFYNLLSPFDPNIIHEVEKNFSVFKPLGLELVDPSLTLNVSQKELQSAREILQSVFGDSFMPFIVLHPGAYQLSNRWPLKNYLLIAEELRKRGKLALFVLGPSEAIMKLEIERTNNPLVSGISILELAAVLSLSQLVLCNDTGIMHISAGVGTRTVALFGKMDPLIWRPPGDLVKAVRSSDNKTSSIKVESVLDALFSQLG